MTGRPTLLTQALIERAEEYLKCWADDGDKVPSIEAFAIFIRIARSTVYEWAKENQAFSDIVEEINTSQAKKLINNGLSGEFQSAVTKMMLSKHGYSEKAEVVNTMQGPGGEPLRAEWVMAPLTKTGADD